MDNYSYGIPARENVRNMNLIKFLISAIIISQIISYAGSSYSNYYSPMVYGGYESFSASRLYLPLMRIPMYISFPSSIILFLISVANRKITSSKHFIPYLGMVLCMIMCLIFKTRDLPSFLYDFGKWGGRLGIVTVSMCSVFFYAKDDLYWSFIKKLLRYIVYIMAALVLYFLITKTEIYSNRIYAFKWLHGFGVILRIASFLVLTDAKNRRQLTVGIAVLLITFIELICLQTRLYYVYWCFMLLLAVFLFVRNKKRQGQIMKKVWVLINLSLIAFLVLIIVLLYTPEIINSIHINRLSSSLIMFSNRLQGSIGRAAQYNNFFTYFWDTFPFGVGYNTVGIESGLGSSGIDNGYLNTMYSTGLLMVLMLIQFTWIPILGSLKAPLVASDIAVVAHAITWIFILATSTTTVFDIEFSFFILCAGRCAYIAELNKERVSTNSAIVVGGAQ